MSWEVFKNNILAVANNPANVKSIEQVADLYAKEYDAAIKRGRDSIHNVSLQKGNVEAMKQLFIVALQKGLNSKEPYDLVGEMGKGVLAYWQGATMNNIPIPIIPAPGSTANVAVISNTITNPGQWQPPQPQTPNFEMSEEERVGAQEDLQHAEQEIQTLQNENAPEDIIKAAEEQVEYQKERLSSNENYSIDDEEVVQPLVFTEIPLEGGESNPIQTSNDRQDGTKSNEPITETEIGKRIVAFATKDIGTLENPLPPGKPENWGTRVSEMLKNVGFNSPAFWCAAAVTSWYKAAGAKYPPSGGASCDVWLSWGKKNGLFSTTPSVGAAVLYGTMADAHHIGIVESVNGDRVKTIEGNTSGGGFNRNGVGVFKKTANIKKVVGFIKAVKK